MECVTNVIGMGYVVEDLCPVLSSSSGAHRYYYKVRAGIPERLPRFTVLQPDRKTYAHCYWCYREDHHLALCHSPIAVSRKCCLGEKVPGKPESQACSMEKLSPSVLLPSAYNMVIVTQLWLKLVGLNRPLY